MKDMGLPSFASCVQWAEQSLGATVCLHDYEGQFRGPVRHLVRGRNLRHDHPTCVSIKAQYPAACRLFDQLQVRDWLQNHRGLLWKRCHGGCVEAVLAVRVRGRLVGAVFAGPWAPSPMPLRASEGLALAAPLLAPSPRASRKLGPLDHATEKRVGPVLVMLGALLERTLAQRLPDREGLADRRTLIADWVDAHSHEAIQLAELAAFLGLSVSRAGQVVRSLFRTTFPKLLGERRWEVAISLLRETTLPVAKIAAQAGFQDARYFHRLFRGRQGTTPRRWRIKQGAGSGGV